MNDAAKIARYGASPGIGCTVFVNKPEPVLFAIQPRGHNTLSLLLGLLSRLTFRLLPFALSSFFGSYLHRLTNGGSLLGRACFCSGQCIIFFAHSILPD